MGAIPGQTGGYRLENLEKQRLLLYLPEIFEIFCKNTGHIYANQNVFSVTDQSRSCTVFRHLWQRIQGVVSSGRLRNGGRGFTFDGFEINGNGGVTFGSKVGDGGGQGKDEILVASTTLSSLTTFPSTCKSS